MLLRRTAFSDPLSHFHHLADASDEEAKVAASHLWRSINLTNLAENILPTCPRRRHDPQGRQASRRHALASPPLRSGRPHASTAPLPHRQVQVQRHATDHRALLRVLLPGYARVGRTMFSSLRPTVATPANCPGRDAPSGGSVIAPTSIRSAGADARAGRRRGRAASRAGTRRRRLPPARVPRRRRRRPRGRPPGAGRSQGAVQQGVVAQAGAVLAGREACRDCPSPQD